MTNNLIFFGTMSILTLIGLCNTRWALGALFLGILHIFFLILFISTYNNGKDKYF